MVRVMVWVTLSACKGSNGGFKDVTYTDGAVAGVGVVSWDSRHSGQGYVRYGLDEEQLDLSSPKVEVSGDTAQITVLGLEVATTHYLQIVVEDGDKLHESGVFEAFVQPPPRDTPSLLFDTWNPDLACDDTGDGYVLLNYLGERGLTESGVGIVDRQGRYVWAIRSEDPQVQFARTRLGRDGRSILWNTNDYARLDDIATIERMSIDGRQSTSTRTRNGHHDFVELPDGELAWIAYELVDPPLELPVEFPPGWSEFPTAYDAIYQAPEGITDTDTPTVVFDQLRDWPEGFYYNDRTERCDQFLPGYCEVGHANSLAYIDSVGQFQMGFRWLDAIVRIDPAGAVQWVFGGPLNEFAGPPADLPVHHHYSDAWADGMMVFDNHDPAPSRAMQYALDTEAKTFSTTLKMQEDENEDILGDVRRVPIEGCTNVLVVLSKQGVLEERTRDGQLVWRVYYDAGDIIGRVQYLSSLYDFAAQANWQ
jgi:hypothetical protein